jgi:hypothetical protein
MPQRLIARGRLGDYATSRAAINAAPTLDRGALFRWQDCMSPSRDLQDAAWHRSCVVVQPAGMNDGKLQLCPS